MGDLMPLGKKKRIIWFLLMFFVCCALSFAETTENENLGDVLSQSSEESFDKEAFINNLLQSYDNSCINGTRIMMETGESARYRYEYVMRKGPDKIVSLKMPYRVTWYRYSNEGFIILDGKKVLMEDMMKDLEDVFLEDIQDAAIDIKLTEIQYSGIPAYYLLGYLENATYRVILLKESMQFIRLEKETASKLTVMLYDNLNQGKKEDFLNQLSWYQDIPNETSQATDGTINNDMTINQDELLKDFEELLEPVLQKYQAQKTEMIEFSDARAMFLTMKGPEKTSPFVIVIVIHDHQVNPTNSESILGKIPDNYQVCQKIVEKVEINVIGSQEKAFLDQIINLITQQVEK